MRISEYSLVLFDPKDNSANLISCSFNILSVCCKNNGIRISDSGSAPKMAVCGTRQTTINVSRGINSCG